MTISAMWVKSLKTHARSHGSPAFKPTPQAPFSTVFIDAQVCLMRTGHVTSSWNDLICWHFEKPVRKWFDAGATRVVVAFDNYQLTPTAKSMTQARRKKNVPDMDVDAFETLPPSPPHNLPTLLMNRTYKTKIVSLVIEFLPKRLRLKPGQTLVIDYDQFATEYTVDSEGYPLPPIQNPDLPPVGECDLKFTRYARYGNLLADSVDGDYIPIALVHLERQALQLGMQVDELPQIMLYRMECNHTGARKPEPESGTRKQKYEYVWVNRLYRDVRDAINESLAKHFVNRAQTGNRLANHEMRVLALLIAMTGTDFTKGMPYVSPQKIWDSLGLVWKALDKCYDPESETLDVGMTTNTVVSRLYGSAFRKHIANDRAPMSEIANTLKRHSPLSELIRKRLPEVKNIDCLIRNCNWTLAYWKSSDSGFPDPVSPAYGYKRNKNGSTCYADD